MKTKVAGLLICGLLCAAAHGQGTILFSTRVPPMVDAPVSGPDGRGFGQWGGLAQLYLWSSGTYTPLLPATRFRNDSPIAAFYVETPASAVIVPGVFAGEQATIVLRAWTGAPTFDAAGFRGQSAPVTITLGGTPAGGGPPLPPAFLTGLQGFTFIAPEPSVTALALLGAALLWRKRKC